MTLTRQDLVSRIRVSILMLAVIVPSTVMAGAHREWANLQLYPIQIKGYRASSDNADLLVNSFLEAAIQHATLHPPTGTPVKFPPHRNSSWIIQFNMGEDWHSQGVNDNVDYNLSNDVRFVGCASWQFLAQNWNGVQAQIGFGDTADFVGTWEYCAADKMAPRPLDPGKASGKPTTCTGNPCDAGSGNKSQSEVDYAGRACLGFDFIRTFNSIDDIKGSVFGHHWTHNFQSRIEFTTPPPTSQLGAILVRPDGKKIGFIRNLFQNGGNPDAPWTSDPDATLHVTTITNGSVITYQVQGDDDGIEIYDASGALQSVTYPDGRKVTLQYAVVPDPPPSTASTTRLTTITGPTGRGVTLNYNAFNQIASLTLPDGAQLVYGYNATNTHLISVTHPGALVRHYLYENSSFPDYLTGILDENGQRYATWGYDATGNVNLSKHGDTLNADKVTLTYNATANTTALTDANNLTRTLSFSLVQGLPLLTGVDGLCPACSGGGFQAATYDVNGN